MKRSAVLVAIAVLALLVPATPSSAASKGATCVLEVGVKVLPGINTKPSKGTFESTTGTLGCVGFIGSTPVGGEGKISFEGLYGKGRLSGLQGGDTCEAGSGVGNAVAVVPKATGGTIKLTGKFKFERLGSNVMATGKLGGAEFVGSFQFLPKVGQDCVQKKVTRATVLGVASLGGA